MKNRGNFARTGVRLSLSGEPANASAAATGDKSGRKRMNGCRNAAPLRYA